MNAKDLRLGEGIPLGDLTHIYGRVFGNSPCDQMEKAIWDSVISPEDRLILISRLRSIRKEIEMLSDRVDHTEADLH